MEPQSVLFYFYSKRKNKLFHYRQIYLKTPFFHFIFAFFFPLFRSGAVTSLRLLTFQPIPCLQPLSRLHNCLCLLQYRAPKGHRPKSILCAPDRISWRSKIQVSCAHQKVSHGILLCTPHTFWWAWETRFWGFVLPLGAPYYKNKKDYITNNTNNNYYLSFNHLCIYFIKYLFIYFTNCLYDYT